jgi:hypothetical protein
LGKTSIFFPFLSQNKQKKQSKIEQPADGGLTVEIVSEKRLKMELPKLNQCDINAKK